MKTKILYLYECTFINDNSNRLVRVAASSFGTASAVAYSVASAWDDFESFELVTIHLNCLLSVQS